LTSTHADTSLIISMGTSSASLPQALLSPDGLVAAFGTCPKAA
jgi:hypothetical protein